VIAEHIPAPSREVTSPQVSIQRSHGRRSQYVEQFLGIDVVVMGTVARTGIAGLVMGNTAERVLRCLRGSVLALKPTGFRTPALE